MGWNKDGARERVRAAIEQFEKLEVRNAKAVGDLGAADLTKARCIDGVHGYVDLINSAELLQPEKLHGAIRSHQRYLRLLHLFQRSARTVLDSAGAAKVDFQNQRLHFVVASPLNDERARCLKAIAVACLLCDLMSKVSRNDSSVPIPALSIGLETGMALAVRNGTKGDREPLFLGAPANNAAKLLGKQGVFIGPGVAKVLGVRADQLGDDERIALGRQAALGVSSERLSREWDEEKHDYPIAEFLFRPPQLPLSQLDFEELGPRRSRHGDMVSVFADIDGFSAFVAKCIDRGRPEDVARALHVIRKELRDTLNDLEGRKVRYHGDCLQGVIACGVGTDVDKERSASRAVLCAAAMLDAFGIIQEELATTSELGLAIGMEAGVTTITRLGVRGTMDRCAVGQAVIAAEQRQRVCGAADVGLGPELLGWASPAIRDLFNVSGKVNGLTYNSVDAVLKIEQANKADDGSVLGPEIVLRRAHASQS